MAESVFHTPVQLPAAMLFRVLTTPNALLDRLYTIFNVQLRVRVTIWHSISEQRAVNSVENLARKPGPNKVYQIKKKRYSINDKLISNISEYFFAMADDLFARPPSQMAPDSVRSYKINNKSTT